MRVSIKKKLVKYVAREGIGFVNRNILCVVKSCGLGNTNGNAKK